ncbi:phage tail assembly protein [Rahnella sikkimica]|nr:phage tail assembly protein [Rahnella sikkimica]
MEEQDKTILIPLDKPLADASGKLVWENIELHEPAVIEVNQFLDKQKASGALAGMGHLICLLSGVTPQVIKRLPFTTYKRCESFLLTFLNYKPENPNAESQPQSSTIIMLANPLQDSAGKRSWSSIDLSEPNLEQVDQFYKTQTVKGGLTSMSALIAELSDIPPEVINRLPYTDYKSCEAYLLGFLNYSPTPDTGGM